MDEKAEARASDAQHTVLYIEDNAVNRLLVERVFEHRSNIDIIVATRGLLGLEMARDHQPAIVLLDIHLPDVNGDKVLTRLRDDPLTRDIPVVVLSADASDRQMQRLLNLGAAAYLTKPLDVHKLLETVDGMISEQTRQ
jgi:CheY-like chemotaxis protein